MINPVSGVEQPKFTDFMKVENEKVSKKQDTNTKQLNQNLEEQESAKVVKTKNESVNALFDGANGNSIRFENNNDEVIIKIMNDKDELVRQIPPEELMAMKSKMEDLKGQFVDAYV